MVIRLDFIRIMMTVSLPDLKGELTMAIDNDDDDCDFDYAG